LERFGDMAAGDRVTVPVRDSAAQALAMVAKPMAAETAASVAGALLTITAETMSEMRHGALLALKYLLASRADALDRLLPAPVAQLVGALTDDDVHAAAAAALIGVAGHLREGMPAPLPRLFGALWAALRRLDDLTASTATMMMCARLCDELPCAQLAAAAPPPDDAAAL